MYIVYIHETYKIVRSLIFIVLKRIVFKQVFNVKKQTKLTLKNFTEIVSFF